MLGLFKNAAAALMGYAFAAYLPVGAHTKQRLGAFLFFLVLFLVLWFVEHRREVAKQRADDARESERDKRETERDETLRKLVATVGQLAAQGSPQDQPSDRRSIERSATVEAPLVEARVAVNSPTILTGRDHWHATVIWGSKDVIPTAGVILVVESDNEEQLRISVCEVVDPVGQLRRFDFTGSGFYSSRLEALAHLRGSSVAAVEYPRLFGDNPEPLSDGKYEVRWWASRDGVEEFPLLSTSFEMRDGRLVS